MRNTNVERRGVEYVLQDPTIFAKAEKSRHRRKDYFLPSGALLRVQGYEPWALDRLLNVEQVSEDDLVVGGGRVWVSYKDTTGQQRRFYPDIYISSQHRIVEVKSTYTYDRHRARNIAKHSAAIAAGYVCEFWVFDGSGNLDVLRC